MNCLRGVYENMASAIYSPPSTTKPTIQSFFLTPYRPHPHPPTPYLYHILNNISCTIQLFFLPAANLNLLLVSYLGCWWWMANWVNERHPLLNAHIRPTSDAGPWTHFNTYNQHHLPIRSRTSTMSTDSDVLHIDCPTADARPSIMSSVLWWLLLSVQIILRLLTN